MSEIVLQPCRVFHSRLIDRRDEGPKRLTLTELRKELVRSTEDVAKLTALRAGIFTGAIRSARTGNPTVFLSDGDLTQALQKDPTIADRIISAYRVVKLDRDFKLQEITPPKDDK